LSGSGPYILSDIITICVPEGNLTIIGCDLAGDGWNEAIFLVSITEDGSVNGCSSQDGCLIYESSVEDANSVAHCISSPENEVVTLSIGACDDTEIITTGCTNPEATNYSICAVNDDGSCLLPSENNDCEDAILIDILDNDCTEYTYEYYNPNGSVDILKDCHNFLGIDKINHDGFYKIVVPSSGQFRFVTDYYDALSLYNNCNDEPIFCGAVNHFTNLTAGDTLILQISNNSYRERKIEFCLHATESTDNSNCADAELINVQNNKECIDENFISLIKFNNNPLNLTPVCNENANSDAFYKFVVPPSRSIRINNNNDYFGVALYNVCNNEPIVCFNQVDQNIISDLVAEDTLILQIFGDNRNVDLNFCIEEAIPSANNDCENPIFIDILEETEIIQSHQYNDLDINSTCLENINADSFFSFVVPNSGQIRVDHNLWGPLQIALYSNCNSEPILCEAVDRYDLISNLTSGDTLLLQIASYYFLEEIRFTLKEAPTSENNDCSNAKFIEVATVDTYSVNPDTLFVNYNTVDIQPECGNLYYDNHDAYYQFIAPPSGSVYFPTEDYVGASLYESCNQNPIFCGNENNGGIEMNNLTPGDTLIMQVFTFYLHSNLYIQLEEIAPTINNTCTDALAINVAPSGDCKNYEVDLSLKFNSPNVILGCNVNVEPDAFYEFVVPSSGSIKIKNSKSTGIALYNFCNETELYCNQDFYQETITNLTPGETLIVQFFERYYNSNRFSFCIEEVAPSVNNNCVNAATITVAETGNCESNQVFVPNFNYNTVNIAPKCESSVSYDAFYEFVVPEAGQVSFSADETVGIAIYQSCNGSSLFCEDYTQNETIRNLPAGENVVLQIFEDYSQPDFNFCLEEVIPAVNDLCINAEPFTVNEPGTCEGNYIQVKNTLNSSNINPYCASFVMADAFYSFIVPPSGHINISTSLPSYNDRLKSW